MALVTIYSVNLLNLRTKELLTTSFTSEEEAEKCYNTWKGWDENGKTNKIIKDEGNCGLGYIYKNNNDKIKCWIVDSYLYEKYDN